MPRVFVICRNPYTQGEITWPGHEIVGYVATTPPRQGLPNVKYYQGWEAIPAELNGTIDIVLGVGCPIGPVIRGEVKTLGLYRLAGGIQGGKEMNDVFVQSLRLLTKKGVLLFGGAFSKSDVTKPAMDLLMWKLPPPPAGQEKNKTPNTVRIVTLKGEGPRAGEPSVVDEPDEFEDEEEEEEEEDEEEDEEQRGGFAGYTWLEISLAPPTVSATAVDFVARNWGKKGLPMGPESLIKKFGGRRRKTRRKRHPRSSRRKSMRR